MDLDTVGFGDVKRLLAHAVQRKHSIVGVVDIDDKLRGLNAGEIKGMRDIGVRVTKSLNDVSGLDVVVQSTSSYLDKVNPQLADLIQKGTNIVSTCETSTHPYYRYHVLARGPQEQAESNGIVVIEVRINPGFLLDILVVTLSSTQPVVEKIVAFRSLNAARRRELFREKIGVGEDPLAVQLRLETRDLTSHVRRGEIVCLISHSGDLRLACVAEHQDPVTADHDVEASGLRDPRGYSKGIHGWGIGYMGNREVIRVELHAYIGAPEYDEIIIEGPLGTIKWRSTGTPGDMGTVSIVLNTVEKVLDLPPGLRLMTELSLFKIRFSV